jgi:L-glyceraldehyde 3-phosphate reductase
VEQLDDTLAALENLSFSEDELREIDRFAKEGAIDLWKVSAELSPSDLPNSVEA